MSDLSPAAQELDEDLRVLMHDLLFPPEAVAERVWGSAEGPPRTLEESRARYRVPIVEAFQASGAQTLTEFPERVLAQLQDCANSAEEIATLRAERDAARAYAADCRNRHASIMSERDAEAAELEDSRRKMGVLEQQIVNLREECTRLYRVEAQMTRRVKWAMARIQDLLLGGDL